MNLIHVLTKGWLLRVFYLLTIGLGIAVSFTIKDKTNVSIACFIGGNFYLYLTLAYRILILSQNDFARTIPTYFDKLKRSLLVIILLSLLPSLILFPDHQLISSVIAWQCLLLITIVLGCFQPKAWFVLAALFVAPAFVADSIIKFSVDFLSYLNYSFPLLMAIVLVFLSRLERIRLSDKVKEQYLSFADQAMLGSFSDAEKKALKSPGKIQQWFNKNNLGVYKTMLKDNKPLKRHQLVEISCVGPSTIGRANWLTHISVIVLFCFMATYFSFSLETLERSYLMFVGVITGGFVGISSIAFLYTIIKRKNYLARLRMSPLFNDEKQFNQALLLTLFKSQITALLLALVNTLIVFIVVIPEHGNVFSNTIAVNALLFFLGSGLILLNFQTRWIHEYAVFFIVSIATFASVIVIDMSLNNQYELINSPFFVMTLLFSVALFTIGLITWQVIPLRWNKAV